MSGLLLGSDQASRAWFATYLRNSHKRGKGDGHASLTKLRHELLNRLKEATAGVDASALLRLYCALRGIAGIKFQDDEIAGLLRLVTQKPPPTPAGVRFVSLSLCMILACPSLMSKYNMSLVLHERYRAKLRVFCLYIRCFSCS